MSFGSSIDLFVCALLFLFFPHPASMYREIRVAAQVFLILAIYDLSGEFSLGLGGKKNSKESAAYDP